MKIYNYSAETGELTGSDDARESPLEKGVFLMPANSTDIEPPPTGENEIAVFAEGAWSVLPDFRGVPLWKTEDATAQLILKPGIRPEDVGMTDIHPGAKPVKWDSDSWKADFAGIRAAKIEEQTTACRIAIYAGFDSDALGARHHYPANDRDQMNLTASVVASLLPGLPLSWRTPFWCSDSDGVWAFRPHSAAQIQKAGSDGKDAVLAALGRREQLMENIAAAKTESEVESIAW